MVCPLCEKRVKDWSGSDPQCAFGVGVFSTDNWRCATMRELRKLVEDSAVWHEDEQAALLPVFDCGEFLLLTWYKSRGRTEGAWIVSESEIRVLTLEDAIKIIEEKKMKNK
jgi:hypothetical protein